MNFKTSLAIVAIASAGLLGCLLVGFHFGVWLFILAILFFCSYCVLSWWIKRRTALWLATISETEREELLRSLDNVNRRTRLRNELKMIMEKSATRNGHSD